MQQLNPSEISEIIKDRIDNLDVSAESRNEGTIVSVSDGIILQQSLVCFLKMKLNFYLVEKFY